MEKARTLTVYFSRTGNTTAVANQIHENAGGDIFEIVPVDAYPTNYNEATKLAKKELKDGYMPKLKTKVADMDKYDVVFVGYPMWWAAFPRPVATFLKENDFSNKTIVPFCTHEGSQLGQSVSDIRKLCPQATVLDGLAVRGSEVKNAQEQVKEWLGKIGMKE
jgi:flavodoxin